MNGARRIRIGAALILVTAGLATIAHPRAAAEVCDTDAPHDRANIICIDHSVPHVSTVPANAGDTVDLFLRERVRRDEHGETPRPRPAILMIHGRSVPVLAVAELRFADYDWALWLAQAGGFDVFMLDFQGSGRSPRPKMDDPCNVPTAQQDLLIPNPLGAKCPHSYASILNTPESDLDELDTVVDYIRTLRGVDKVHLISWSQGSFRVGPYAVRHPDKVASLFLLAAIFNTNFTSSPRPPDPTPMTLTTRAGVLALWDPEVKHAIDAGCQDPREPGIEDVVWAAIMENDELGRTWGPPPAGAPPGSPPEGVMRVRQVALPLWNANVASSLNVPTLIIRGEFDTGQGARQDLAELYDLVQNPNKLRFKVQCTGHNMPWENRRGLMQQVSKEWIKHGRVGGYEQGEFFIDTDGNLIPLVE